MANEKNFSEHVKDAQEEMKTWPQWLKEATRLEGRTEGLDKQSPLATDHKKQGKDTLTPN